MSKMSKMRKMPKRTAAEVEAERARQFALELRDILQFKFEEHQDLAA